ncbi:hypothetical protein Leryth_007661 [Lithospermum erythrorhizon]|nr:hypothetical protein Leryth_007661 [Lithospermum erythrorhizon]
MPYFSASLGSTSSGIAFLSHILTTESVTHNHNLTYGSLHATPYFHATPLCSLSSLNYSQQWCYSRRQYSVSRTPKVSVSSDNAKVEEELELEKDSVTPDDVRRARRSADWKAARAYYERGLIYEGRIESSNGGGLLIRFSSLIGFLPYPQLSPTHSCKEPEKSIQEIARGLTGSIISVKVIKADEPSRKLIFSEKEANWARYSNLIKVGDILDTKVGSLEEYGAFLHLRFPDGGYYLTGLVHISEVSWDLVHDVQDVLTVGDELMAKVVNIDRAKSRITLSIKQLEEDPLFETLEKVIPQDGSVDSNSSNMSDISIEPLPGLEGIFDELLKEDGIKDVKITRQGFERRVVSQDLQLWLSNVS